MKPSLFVLLAATILFVGCSENLSGPDTDVFLIADETAPLASASQRGVLVCHALRETQTWALLNLPVAQAQFHQTNHPFDSKPGDSVPGNNAQIFDQNCIPITNTCPIWNYQDIAAFTGWQFFSDSKTTGSSERSTILDGQIGGYGNAFIFSPGFWYAQMEIEPDGGPNDFRFTEDLNPRKAAGCRAILRLVAEERGITCVGEYC